MSARHQAAGSAQPPVIELQVHGVVTIVLELCLCLENLLPVFVVIFWRRPRQRTVSDKLIASLSAIYILSALLPTPLGLASYFHGSWYGGAATCQCFQVTSMWCSLSALAVVTYLAVDLHLTVCRQHADSTCSTPEVACGGQSGQSAWRRSGRGGKDCANTLLFVLFTVTLLIASLPVAGYGPEVRPANSTCDSWLVYTPSSGPRRTFFVAFLSFGFLNLLTMTAAVGGATWVLRAGVRRAGQPGVLRYTAESGDTQKREAIHSDIQKREAIHSDIQKREAIHSGALRYTAESEDAQKREAIHSEGLRYTAESSNAQKREAIHSNAQKREAIPSRERRYTEESDTPLDHPSASHCYKMTGFILVNQAMWLPTLVIVTVQKLGYSVTDATMMYAILSTSLPGLLNPLLLALLYRNFRLGYRHVFRSVTCCCARTASISSSMTNLRSRSADSLLQPDKGDESWSEPACHGNDLTSAGRSYSVYSCPQRRESEASGGSGQHCASYLVLEVATERTPLQGPPPAPVRPTIASLYDEYGELSGAATTELLSPCGSEECLLNAELFRCQTESVV